MVWEADQQRLLSDEHFSVDGTLIEAAASIKSFRRRQEVRNPPDDDPGNPSVDFHGEALRNETQRGSTDPEARLIRKGKEAKLVFMRHALMENRNGLLMDFVVSGATGVAERDTVPEVAQRVHSAIDVRTKRYSGYRERQKIRKQVEDVFGWMKTVDGFRRTRYRGVELTGLVGYFVATACSLVRMANLLSCQPTRAIQSV